MTIASHFCFLVHDFAEAAEDLCAENHDQYYCRIWNTYENACMNVDEQGNWVLAPDPAVYHQLMGIYFSHH